jgi:PST family polysaccharide transporter
VLPVALVMAVLAHPIVTFLYGAQWEMSAGVLRFLAILMVVRMLTAFAFDILTSTGATRSTVWLNLAWCLALLPALWVGTELDGIRGAAVGHAVAGLFVALPIAVVALRPVGVRLAPVLPALVRPALAGLVMAAVMVPLAALVGGNPFVRLCVVGGAGLLVYVVVVSPWAELRRLGGRVGRLIPARAR